MVPVVEASMMQNDHDEPDGTDREHSIIGLVASLDPGERLRLSHGVTDAIRVAVRLRASGATAGQISSHLLAMAAELQRCGDERLIGFVLLQRRYELFSTNEVDEDHVFEVDRLIDWIREGCSRVGRPTGCSILRH
jgi:hypothetical protein